MTGSMHDMEIIWEDLLDAFQNSGTGNVYFLDRETGEVFTVPVHYEDQEFWTEVGARRERYLPIPASEPDEERAIIHAFLKGVTEPLLRDILEKSFVKHLLFGRLDDILSFYPVERDRLRQLREDITTGRISRWLEENNIYATRYNL